MLIRPRLGIISLRWLLVTFRKTSKTSRRSSRPVASSRLRRASNSPWAWGTTLSKIRLGWAARARVGVWGWSSDVRRWGHPPLGWRG